jgi:outer membrane biosynthesis protein TonB
MKILGVLKEEDHRKALYASMVFVMLMILFFLLVSLEQPNPPLQDKIIEIELPDIEVEMGSQPAGGSTNNNEEAAPKNNQNVEDSPRNVITQREETTPVPKGNGTSNTNNSNNEPKPDNTFTFGGGGGSGNGSGTSFGNGSGVGGNGDGNTPGDGTYNTSRKVTTRPSFNSNAQEEGTIALDIWIDANGNVVNTKYKESKSSSGSEYLIGLARKAAKTMKYDKKPNASVEHVGYQVFSFTKS